MTIKLNEDELDIYNKAECSMRSLLEDFISDKGYDIVWELIAEHPYKNEANMPPGSTGVDASVDRIVWNLRETFTKLQ